LPTARACHPVADHPLPLMVAAGAAGEDRGRHACSDRIPGKAVSGFQFGWGPIPAAPDPCFR